MKKTLLIVSLFALSIFASGCLFGPSEDALSGAIDPPQEDYIEQVGENYDLDFSEDGNEEGAEEEEIGDEASEEVERQIYVFDHQGYVVPITIQTPKTEGVASQALEYLVTDGPVSTLLPDGMRAVLPAGTELSVNIIPESDTAVVDFSSEFSDYPAEDEKGILEAITWTLTQFDAVKQVEIMINGYPQEVMPVNQTPIHETLSREDGINLELAETTHVGHNSVVTLYFKSQTPSGAYDYYVPVSRVIPKSENVILSTVQEYISGPRFDSGLYSELDRQTEVLEVDTSGNIATINFSEHFLLYDGDGPKVADDVLYSLMFSLTETGLVEEVEFMVNGEKGGLTIEGKDLSQPLSRPALINVTGF